MRNISKVLVGSLAAVAVIGAHAATVGSYVGAGVGYSDMKYRDDNAISGDKRDGLAGRIFAGYNMSETLGVEFGISRPAKEKIDGSVNGINYNISNQLTIADVRLKGYYPLTSKLDLMAFGGVALAHSYVTMKGTDGVNSFSANEKENGIRPEVGVGASYALTQNISALGEYSYMLGKGGYTQIPSVQMATVGLAYNFG